MITEETKKKASSRQENVPIIQSNKYDFSSLILKFWSHIFTNILFIKVDLNKEEIQQQAPIFQENAPIIQSIEYEFLYFDINYFFFISCFVYL
jgi:hypothetical protein